MLTEHIYILLNKKKYRKQYVHINDHLDNHDFNYGQNNYKYYFFFNRAA